jgi:hypothetical protein
LKAFRKSSLYISSLFQKQACGSMNPLGSTRSANANLVGRDSMAEAQPNFAARRQNTGLTAMGLIPPHFFARPKRLAPTIILNQLFISITMI